MKAQDGKEVLALDEELICEAACVTAETEAISEDAQSPTKEKERPVSEPERQKLEKIWSRRMALWGLKRIYLAALEGARTEIRDKDGALVEVKFSPTAAAAATKAIEVANRMLGYTTPDERESDLSLCVELGESEALAK